MYAAIYFNEHLTTAYCHGSEGEDRSTYNFHTFRGIKWSIVRASEKGVSISNL